MPSGLPDLLGIAPAPDQNFAVGGAETGDGNIADALLPPSIELPGIAEQIDSFVSSGESIGSDALVVLYGGSNDYFGFLDENADPTSGEVSAFVDVTIGNIEDDIRSLAAAGATTILVPNVPNLGATPSYLGSDKEAAATALSAEHAAALNDELGALGDELGVEIVVADFATGFDLLLSDPALFGVTDVTTPCVTSSSDLPAYVTPGTVCSEEEQATRLFWDSVHPTSIGHELLAEYAADTLAAPTTLAAQAELAAIAGDDFLRRIDQALQVGIRRRRAITTPGGARSAIRGLPRRQGHRRRARFRGQRARLRLFHRLAHRRRHLPPDRRRDARARRRLRSRRRRSRRVGRLHRPHLLPDRRHGRL